MPETVLACPLCGADRHQLFDRRKFYGQEVTNQLCCQCGLVYQSPRMSAQEAGVFYEQEYRRLYQGSAGPNTKDLSVQQQRADVLFAFTRPRVEAVSRHLDIGCSAGLLLKRFQAGYLCQSMGIEPGEAYRQYAQAAGLQVYASLDELPEGRFDLISLAHVLEHLPDPVNYLIRLRQDFLYPNGHLLLEVPNLYAHECFEIAHLISFSTQTLLETVRLAGYDSTFIRPHGLPRSTVIPLYLTLLAVPGGSPQPPRPLPETQVRLKRSLGVFYRRLLSRLKLGNARRSARKHMSQVDAHS